MLSWAPIQRVSSKNTNLSDEAARLKNGGQFEYFYLIITQDGFMYLVAEYAYG